MRLPEMEYRNAWFWAWGAAFFLLSAVLRYAALSQTPFANGWDGYFYLVQLKSWEETGTMHSPEASLIYPYLRLVYWLTGDYVNALKTGSAILAGLFTWIMYAGPGGVSFEKRLLPGAFSLFSPHLTWFAAQYPKNLLGAVLFLAFTGSLSRLSGSRKPDRASAWILPAGLLGANYFGHRMTFALALLYGLFWLIFTRKDEGLSFRRIRRIATVAAIGLVLFYVAGRFFPGLLHWVDLGRLGKEWSSSPQFAPWSFLQVFRSARISGWWMAEIVLCTGLWALFGGLFFSGRLTSRSGQSVAGSGALFCLCTLLLFPFLEWSLTGIAFRLFLVFVLFTPHLVIGVSFPKSGISGLIFAAFFIVSSFFSWKCYRPAWHDPDYASFSTTTTNAQQYLSGKSPELVIAHNSLAEFFTFTTGTDAMPWLPEYDIDSSRLWRITAGISAQTLKYYAGPAGDSMVHTLRFRYCLLPEFIWARALQRAKNENDGVFLTTALSWRNPSQTRPGWLLHRKRKY